MANPTLLTCKIAKQSARWLIANPRPFDVGGAGKQSLVLTSSPSNPIAEKVKLLGYHCYVDANLEQPRSMTNSVHMLGKVCFEHAPLRQHVVSVGAHEAETHALCTVTSRALSIRGRAASSSARTRWPTAVSLFCKRPFNAAACAPLAAAARSLQ